MPEIISMLECFSVCIGIMLVFAVHLLLRALFRRIKKAYDAQEASINGACIFGLMSTITFFASVALAFWTWPAPISKSITIYWATYFTWKITPVIWSETRFFLRKAWEQTCLSFYAIWAWYTYDLDMFLIFIQTAALVVVIIVSALAFWFSPSIFSTTVAYIWGMAAFYIVCWKIMTNPMRLTRRITTPWAEAVAGEEERQGLDNRSDTA